MRVVLDLLTKAVCQSRKSARVHTNAEIGALGKRRADVLPGADVLPVRIAFDPLLATAGAFGRAISAFGAIWRGATIGIRRRDFPIDRGTGPHRQSLDVIPRRKR
jgi:hypothetical protein